MVGLGIKKLRETRGITQEELAEKLGVSRQAICMWERERREIRATMLNKIAKIFGVTLDEMMKPERFENIRKEERNMKKTKGIKKEQKKVKFELMAPEAKKVMLAGDFNSWNETGIALKKARNGLWKTDLSLSPGRYEYKFVVDGHWWTDPSNSYTVTNAYGSENSVKDITT